MAMKVHELAKELDIESKEVLKRLNRLGLEAKSHMSVLTDSACQTIRNQVAKEKGGDASASPSSFEEKPAAPASAPAPEQAPAPAAPKKAEEAPKASDPSKAEKAQSGEKPARPARSEGGRDERQPRRERPEGRDERQPRRERPEGQGEKQPRRERPEGQGERQPRRERPEGGQGERQPRRERPEGGQGERQPRRERPEGAQGERQPRRDRNDDRQGDRPRRNDGERGDRRPQGERPPRRDDRPGRRDVPAQASAIPEKTDTRRADKKPARRQQESSAAERMENKSREDKPFNKVKQNKPYQKKGKDMRKEQRKEAALKAEEEAMAIPLGAAQITVPITVKGFSEQTNFSTSQIIMALMKMGIMANINQSLDEDTVSILADELNISIYISKVEEEVVEEGIENYKDREEDLVSRPPIVTVMGHVDHGKTSLLDKIRSTEVASDEAGGITQHIGASEVHINGQKIVFLDTPGHEAFTAMRARGAYITDIAVLVVAADDSVKPQTVEAISHAKAANVPIIVAINKMDKPGANPDRVKQDLTEHGILVEEWGGDTICVPVSAKTGEGIEQLLEMILLQAEMMELKANPDRLALGTVIEARLDNTKGAVATLLVLNGTLQAGSPVIAGTCSGRIRAMTNFKGEPLKKAGPATAVEILGLTDVPEAGDEFNAVRSDKVAREIAEQRKMKLREEVMQKNSSTTLEQLFSQIQQGEVKELNLIIKADVMGSAGALVSSLEKLNNDEVKVRIIHTGVGTVTESDIMLASTSSAVIICFNVRPTSAISATAEHEGVEIRNYRVIYDVINDVEAAMKGLLDPEFKEVVLGTAEIRNTFKVPNVGVVGGAYVTEGKVERNADIRLLRDGVVIHEGKISSLKRFKDDAKEVLKGYECGIGIENYNDIKEGDVIEAFKMEEIERK